MHSDVLIVGGGVIGLSIARELHKKGLRPITVVDRSAVGNEASWAAAGMLAPNVETDSSEEFHRFGTESLKLYPAFAEELVEETGIDIELDQSGTLYLAFDENERDELRQIYRRQTLRSVPVEHLSGEAIRDLEPLASPHALEGLFYPSDWQVDNRKLMLSLKEFAKINNIRVVENFEVATLVSEGGRITGAADAAGQVVHADVTILATGAWTSLIKIGGAFLPVEVKPIRGQMICFDTGERLLRRVIYSHRGYIVPRADGRVLVGATVEDAGFDKSTTDEGIASLKDAAIEIAPLLRGFGITERWAGLRPLAANGMPVVGEVPGYDNLFVASGHYRNGILLAPKTAEIVTERIVHNVDSDYLRIFSLGRIATVRTV